MSKLNDTLLTDDHYVIPLPFKKDEPQLPTNKPQAIIRAECLKKRLQRDDKRRRDYTVFITTLLEKGYARKVPQEQKAQCNGRVWYLPHHGVYHPYKPDKIRVVFDCSARYQGTSLNDQLLKGTDYTNYLTGVLTRFRQYRIAVMTDVESMFYQVRVPEIDSDALRFLRWLEGNLGNNLEEYQMVVHIFGAVSSPSIANYALRKTAADNKKTFNPTVVETVNGNF